MDNLNMFIYGDMEKALDTVRKIDAKKDADLERLREENRKLREEYNKDAEIKELLERIGYLKSHSLHVMSDKEMEADKAFRDEHYKKCKNGHHYIYELTGSGLGVGIDVVCPVCGEKKDITDTSNW